MKKSRLLLSLLPLLCGCNGLTGFEKDVSVLLLANTDLVGTLTVNIFNNAILPECPEGHTPDGYQFMGWTLDPTFGTAGYVYDKESEYTYKPGGIIRYDDVKEFIDGSTVNLNAIFIDIDDLPEPYLVMGWYAKTATSGLTSAIMENLETAMVSYLEKEGVSQDELDTITIRPYSGSVADMGTSINADGDVDILVGVGNNINSTGGVSIIEKLGGFTMGGKDKRYIARLTDKEGAVKVYNWLQTDEAKAALQ